MDMAAVLRDQLQSLREGKGLADGDLSNRVRGELRQALGIKNALSIEDLRTAVTQALRPLIDDVSDGDWRIALEAAYYLHDGYRQEKLKQRRTALAKNLHISETTVRKHREDKAIETIAARLAEKLDKLRVPTAEEVGQSSQVRYFDDPPEGGVRLDSSNSEINSAKTPPRIDNGKQLRRSGIRTKIKVRLTWLSIGVLIPVALDFAASLLENPGSEKPVVITVPGSAGTYSDYPHDGRRYLKSDGSSIWDFNIAVRKGTPGPNNGMDMNFSSSAAISRISASLTYKPDPDTCKLDLRWVLRSQSSGTIEAQGRIGAGNPTAKINQALNPVTSKFNISANFDWQKKGDPSDVSVSSDPPCGKASLVVEFSPMYPAG